MILRTLPFKNRKNYIKKMFLLAWALTLYPKTATFGASVSELNLEEYLKEHTGHFCIDSTQKTLDIESATNVEVASFNYSVNLFWINKDYDYNFKNDIFPTGYNSAPIFENIKEWCLLSPEVNFWYDNNTSNFSSIDNMKSKLIALCGSKITLKDINTLQSVKEHRSVFTPNTPIYFRVDLARVIAATEVTDSGKYFVYADLDMVPASKEQLFDRHTMANLEKFGIVLSRALSGFSFENGFQIIVNKSHSFQAIKDGLIEPNIKKAEIALSQIDSITCGKFRSYNEYELEKNLFDSNMPEAIYKDYDNLFLLLYHYMGIIELQSVYCPNFSCKYEKNIHGLTPFMFKHANSYFKNIKILDNTMTVDIEMALCPVNTFRAVNTYLSNEDIEELISRVKTLFSLDKIENTIKVKMPLLPLKEIALPKASGNYRV